MTKPKEPKIIQGMLDKDDGGKAGHNYYSGDVTGCRLLLKLLKKFHPNLDPDNKQTLDH